MTGTGFPLVGALFGILASMGVIGILLWLYITVFDFIWTYLKGEKHLASIVEIIPANDWYDGTKHAIVVRYSVNGHENILITQSFLIISNLARKRKLEQKVKRYINREVLLFIRRKEPYLLSKQLRNKTVSFVIKNKLIVRSLKPFIQS